MALYIQHGHGKSDKITSALDNGVIDGVIFGARNEKPENLRNYIDEIRENYSDCELFLDPQFYISTLNPPNDRFLPEYPYYSAGRTANDFTGARRISQYAKECIDFQVDLGLNSIISPTVIFDSFSERWCQIALNLADESLEYHSSLTNPPPLLISFIFSEQALVATDEVNRFLDAVTQDKWKMDGFYLIIARDEKSYNQIFDTSRLTQYLYIIHVLGQINNLRVICGYSDFVGIPLRAVGASAFASGWNHSLRQFYRSNFIQRPPGGQRALERYSSSPLYNSILLSQLQDIYDVNRLEDVLSGVPLDSIIRDASDPSSAGWTTSLSQQHHWQTLNALDTELSGRIRQDLRNIVQRLRYADGLYTMLEGAGVQFDRNSGPSHLMEWVRAINEFQRMVGLPSS
jgi:hypothetical protein